MFRSPTEDTFSSVRCRLRNNWQIWMSTCLWTTSTWNHSFKFMIWATTWMPLESFLMHLLKRILRLRLFLGCSIIIDAWSRNKLPVAHTMIHSNYFLDVLAQQWTSRRRCTGPSICYEMYRSFCHRSFIVRYAKYWRSFTAFLAITSLNL